MFYPDEKVIVSFKVDNSKSARDIKEIDCTLNYQINIKKNAYTPLVTFSSDLYLLQFRGVEKNQIRDNEEIVLNLKQIFESCNNIKESQFRTPSLMKEAI